MKKEIITELLFDMYGNYVVQKLLAATTNETRNFMLTVYIIVILTSIRQSHL